MKSIFHESKVMALRANELLQLSKGIPVKTNHVDLKPSKDWLEKKEWHGKLLTRTSGKDGKQKLEIIKPSDYNSVKKIIFGGVDFDTSAHIAALLKNFKVINPNLQPQEQVAIFPSVDRKERFDAAFTYNGDKLYYPPYIEQLTREYILPRFVCEETGKLKVPKTPITCDSFSLGGREIPMMENCLRFIFKENYGATPAIISHLFKHLNSVSIAYAPDCKNLPEPRFAKKIIFSSNDVGVLRPDTVLEYFAKTPSDVHNPKVCHGEIPATELSPITDIYYLEPGLVPIIIEDKGTLKVSTNGHSLPHYVEAIKNTELMYELEVTSVGEASHYSQQDIDALL